MSSPDKSTMLICKSTEISMWRLGRAETPEMLYYKAISEPWASDEEQRNVCQAIPKMSPIDWTRRQSRSSQMNTQPEDRHERRRPSYLIFMQNKVPADFAAANQSAASTLADIEGDKVRRRGKPSDDALPSVYDRSSRDRKTRHSSIPRDIPNSSLLEHIATSRFFHHYVSPTRTFFRLDLDFTHSVIDRASKRAILAEAIIAMGILTLPNKSRAVYMAARIRHTRALRLTNKALRDAEFAKSDEMLMAVILLGLYETTPDATHSITSWTSHLDGARHLLRIRGKTLLETDTSYQLFNVLRGQILLNCFMSMQRMPQDLVDLSDAIGESQSGEEKAASDLVSLFARMCDLVASTRESANADVSRTISDAAVLDSGLLIWATNLPGYLQISTQPAPPMARAYSDSCEVFSSILSAELWILYRTARFGVNGLLASLYSAIALQHTDQSLSCKMEQSAQEAKGPIGIALKLQECLNHLEALKVDMCSTIPFLLERHNGNVRATADLPLCNRTPAINMLVFLIRMQGTSEKMCNWAQDLLDELQAEDDVDKGAIWMNNSPTVNKRHHGPDTQCF